MTINETKTNGVVPAATDAGDFFIPDLCATRPVFLMFIIAELFVVVYVLGGSVLPVFDWGAFALASLFVQWIVLLSAGLLCVARPVLTGFAPTVGVALSYGIILLVSLCSSALVVVVFENSVFAPLDGWWVLRNTLVAGVVGGIALRFFYLQHQLLAREQAELNARIESLRSRIRPHFLFNTMNSIASLIGSRPEQAEQVVEDLSELFRASLVEHDDRATLADELHLCKLYLNIEQLRLGDRMAVRWEVADEVLDWPMPALLLQPLVENAVYHGVARMPEGGEIIIRARVDGDLARVTIGNPVPADGVPAPGGHQIALDNIRQRLDAMYGGVASLSLEPGSDWHEVELVVPGNGGIQ